MRWGTIFRTVLISSAVAVLLVARVGAAESAELRASYATLGGETSVPYGWLDFCGREPQECNQPVLQAADVDLTSDTLRILNRINQHVNHTIQPISNLQHWGTMLDHWDYPTDGKGDCKIYALYKRKLLMAAGLPRQALLMTITRNNGEGHAILTVETNKGEFVLDNLTDQIRPWDATGYQFLKRQSQENPNIWVSIAETKSLASNLR
jgi:predicted transglutaminase-like cysteine proteinase